MYGTVQEHIQLVPCTWLRTRLFPGVQRRFAQSIRSGHESWSSKNIQRLNRLNQLIDLLISLSKKLFKVDLVVNSSLVSDLEIFHQLKEIRRVSAATERPQLDLGYLTSLPRRDWCAVRQNLLKDPINARSLDLIERCSFMICLDEKVDSSDEFVGEDTKNGMQILHGSGIQFNSRNRWFDKSLQFVVSEDGVNGLIREHTPSEGPITVNLINHVYKYL